MAKTEQGTAVDPRTASELVQGGAQLVDVRSDDEHDAGGIDGSTHIRLDRLTQDHDALDRDRPIVFYCRSGDRSELPADAFRASGWETYHVEGGLLAWVEAGLPVRGEVAERSKLPGA
ncbi:MAG TPA: rhodanese-like domain-containing protein [Thermoleophilaceae bacterium]|nr:rhodanese-like domain-containing protein [Thermoleophilaceae bacterium]